MPSSATAKLIKALQLTAERINNFLETNREIFGELDPSPYGFTLFCSFLVLAGYAPPRRYFPESRVERSEAETKEFRQIVIQTMTRSLLDRHAEAFALIESREEKEKQALKIRQQVEGRFEEKYSEYFELLRLDVEKLAEDPNDAYANLSAAFLRDVVGKRPGGPNVPAPDTVSFGLCLSTTVSGLMAFFDRPESPEPL